MTDTPTARLPHEAVAHRPRRQAHARLRQSAAAARLHGAVSDRGRSSRDGGTARRARADLRPGRQRDALGAGGHDRRGRRRHALRHRVFRPGGGDDAAAGVPQCRRSLPDAGPRLWPDAQLRRGHAEASRHRDDLLSIRKSTRPASPRCCGRTRAWCSSKAPAAIRSRCRTCRPSPARRMRRVGSQGADGQHLGHPSLPAVHATASMCRSRRRRNIQPGTRTF